MKLLFDCVNCGKLKPFYEFKAKQWKKDTPCCIKCQKAIALNKAKMKSQKAEHHKKAIESVSVEISFNVYCNQCKTNKSYTSFSPWQRARGRNSNAAICLECVSSNKKAYHKQYRKTYNKTPSLRYNTYKKGALDRGYVFSLTFEQFVQFWQKPCIYCGDKIKTIGLDRIDNNRGYEIDNITSCCSRCNRMKLAYTKQQFLEHIQKIAEYCKL